MTNRMDPRQAMAYVTGRLFDSVMNILSAESEMEKIVTELLKPVSDESPINGYVIGDYATVLGEDLLVSANKEVSVELRFTVRDSPKPSLALEKTGEG